MLNAHLTLCLSFAPTIIRNNLGTALFQIGEHTLAKVEHTAVLALLEEREESVPQPRDANDAYDVHIDTLVNLHR